MQIRDQGSCQTWVWDPGWQKLDPGSWIRDVYPGSGILDSECLTRIRNTDFSTKHS